MATIQHSLKVHILKALANRAYGYYEKDLKAQVPSTEGELFQISIDRLIEVKYIYQIKGVDKAYNITSKGKEVYQAYVSELIN